MKTAQVLVVAFILVMAGSCYLGYTPPGVGVVIVLLSMVAFFLYARDKAAAIAGTWRISEKTLHMASLFGGWPGALVAQQRLRHKTKKTSFRAVFWVTVLANMVLIGWLHSPHGNAQLRYGFGKVENVMVFSARNESILSALHLLTAFRCDGVWIRPDQSCP